MFIQLILIFMLVVVIRFFEHTPKKLILPGMFTEIDRIAIIILKKSFDIGLTGTVTIHFIESG